MTLPAAGQTFARVIHPTDLSPDGDLAFAHGVRIALAARGRITIVHTGDSSAIGNEWATFPKVRERLARWGLLAAGATEEDVVALGLQVSKADLGADHPAKAIAVYAERHGCDLIVLATHARHGVQRWLVPAVAEPLARTAEAPTLFLPEGASGFVDAATGAVSLKTILVPIDTSPDPARAIELALSLARSLGVEDAVFHLLHIGPDDPVLPDALVGHANIRWVVATDGPVVETICETAEDIGCDLIVMATRGHDGFLDALRGNTTEQVLRTAGRALLAVPQV